MVFAIISVQSCSSVQLIWTHGLQYAKRPCPSPTLRVCSNYCPNSQWCHPAISSSVNPFSPCFQSLPASGSFPAGQFFTHQVAIVLEFQLQHQSSNEYSGWLPLGLTGLISLQSKELSRIFSNTTVQKHQFSSVKVSLWSNSPIDTWPLENHSFDYKDLCQ